MDFSQGITIGQYIPGKSLLHKLDSRTKLIQFIIFVLAASFCTSYIGNLMFLGLFLILFIVSGISLSFLWSSVRPALPFLFLFALLQFFFNGSTASGNIYYHKGIITISSLNIQLIIVSALRFIEIITLLSILTLTTTLSDLTKAIEQLLSPLKKIRIPIHEFSLIITIAIRFVPTFSLEMDKVKKAQASRGASYGMAKWWQIVKRTKETFPLIIPLFQISLERAEDLILAMESRAYIPGVPRTSYHVARLTLVDWIITCIVIVIAGAILSI